MVNRAGWRCTVSVLVLSSIVSPAVLAAEDTAQEKTAQEKQAQVDDDHSYLPPWMRKGNGETSNAGAKSAAASGMEHRKQPEKTANAAAGNNNWTTVAASSPKETASASGDRKILPFRQFGDNIIHKFASLFESTGGF